MATRTGAFVSATGHVTDAERYGASFVFGGLLPDDFPPTRGVAAAPWWREVPGAGWRHPEGPGSTLDGREYHPVVHVSWYDAAAYSRRIRARRRHPRPMAPYTAAATVNTDAARTSWSTHRGYVRGRRSRHGISARRA
ncbi:SUMF1/EgtB/PvdO family nonheme iron enzyme [Streptomyces sp. NBC_00191]|uniref:SUMF1/EgtB/PvdO family nonheme iron enzyme n=1 Tax=Streptomyces sp. NBC_00191 TaxID=2975674 RepID=UPI00386DC465